MQSDRTGIGYGRQMNVTRLALVGFVVTCAWVAWPRQPRIIDSHLTTRQFVINSTLNRVEDAIVVLGDSIIEASTLPRLLCGHTVVNAGIGGLSTTTALRTSLGDMFPKRANSARQRLTATTQHFPP